MAPIPPSPIRRTTWYLPRQVPASVEAGASWASARAIGQLCLEIEPSAERGLDTEVGQRRDEVQRGRELEEQLESRRVGEHQIDTHGHARREREAVAGAAAIPD